MGVVGGGGGCRSLLVLPPVFVLSPHSIYMLNIYTLILLSIQFTTHWPLYNI